MDTAGIAWALYTENLSLLNFDFKFKLEKKNKNSDINTRRHLIRSMSLTLYQHRFLLIENRSGFTLHLLFFSKNLISCSAFIFIKARWCVIYLKFQTSISGRRGWWNNLINLCCNPGGLLFTKNTFCVSYSYYVLLLGWLMFVLWLPVSGGVNVCVFSLVHFLSIISFSFFGS